MATDAERVEVRSREELRNWLLSNHRRTRSVWLISYKKGSPFYLPYQAIVDEALCFGWIDSLPRTLDAERSMRRLSPRSAKSAWSANNKAHIERLIADGLMHQSGLDVIAAAKASGSWSKLDDAETLEPPHDLIEALAKMPPASEYFAAFPKSVKRAILEWITQAKRPETRQKRVDETARLAQQNVRANQFRQ